MNEPLNTKELDLLTKKVKDGSATNNEMVNYLKTVNGLFGEFVTTLQSMPTDKQLEEK